MHIDFALGNVLHYPSMSAVEKAKKIVQKLAAQGHQAYFAGGWVRDFLLGLPSEDIDIVTSAMPSEILDLFPETLLVGLAFGVVLVSCGEYQFEVATFRRDEGVKDGRRPESISFSTPQEDAQRRDFTINGMFFNPLTQQVLDFVHGRVDLERGVIRAIGDPQARFFEDRLRMIRAFRFSARFGFAIELATQEAITENATYLFPSVAQERVWQELTKMAAYPRFDVAVAEMHRLHILQEIFPELAHLHLQELRQRVSSFRHFPQNTPTLLYLAELFEGLELEEKVAIAKRISAPNREIKLMEHMHALFPRLQRGLERNVETLHLLAHSATELGIKLFVANLQEEERALVAENIYRFLEENQDLIGRVREKRPLVCAADLMKRGIAPGRKMGEWLKQAEKVAVEKGCATKEEVFQCLPQFEV